MAFHRGETIICSAEHWVMGELADPVTSMKITITDNRNGTEVDNQDMVKDETGEYHYDFNSSADNPKGQYSAVVTATDGTRVTIEPKTFDLE